MKRTKNLIKAAAFLLAIMMVLSFASCNAAQAPDVNLEGLPSIPSFPSNGGIYDDGIVTPPADKDEAENAPEIESPEGEPVPPSGEEPETDSPDVDLPETDSPDVDLPETDAPDVGDPEPVAPITLLKGSFTKTSEQPFSTFSADVDTASYTYFRKLANSGYYKFNDLRNSGSEFRIEEFINYFRYEVDQPKDGELFGVKTEITACPWDAESLLFRVTLQAEDAKPSAGNNLVFLIDVSGSMSSQDKLPLLKKAFAYLVGKKGYIPFGIPLFNSEQNK